MSTLPGRVRERAALRVVLLGLLERLHGLRVHARYLEGLARLVVVLSRLERVAARPLHERHLARHLGGRQILVRLGLHNGFVRLLAHFLDLCIVIGYPWPSRFRQWRVAMCQGRALEGLSQQRMRSHGEINALDGADS